MCDLPHGLHKKWKKVHFGFGALYSGQLFPNDPNVTGLRLTSLYYFQVSSKIFGGLVVPNEKKII